MPSDLHTHTEASSDSSLSMGERVAIAADHDLTAVAITDHMAVHEWLTDREGSRGGVRVIAGVEINCTVSGSRIDVLGLFVDPGRLRRRVGETTNTGVTVEDGASLDPGDAVEWIHDAGGAAVLAHPARYDRDLAALIEALPDGLDGIETEYPYDRSPTDAPHTSVEAVREIAAESGLLRAGGSDCHGPGHHGGASMGAVRLSDRRVEALRRASEAYR